MTKVAKLPIFRLQKIIRTTFIYTKKTSQLSSIYMKKETWNKTK